VHDLLVNSTKWNENLLKLNWRVDTKAKSRKSGELNNMTAILEMTVGKKQTSDTARVIRFEMDKQQLDDLLKEFTKIQNQINNFGEPK
jgi:hypothetical protein